MTRNARSRLGKLLDFAWPLAWLLVIPAILAMPPAFWYELRSIVVTDEFTVDGDRIVEIDRSIYRPFDGRWRVEEQVKVADKYVTVQVCRGEARYYPDKTLPRPATLAWWKGDDCHYVPPFMSLVPDLYRLCTFIEWDPRFFPTKDVMRCSSDFIRR